MSGFLAGWRWEGLAGLLAVVGFAAFAITVLIVSSKPPAGAIPISVVPGPRDEGDPET